MSRPYEIRACELPGNERPRRKQTGYPTKDFHLRAVASYGV